MVVEAEPAPQVEEPKKHNFAGWDIDSESEDNQSNDDQDLGSPLPAQSVVLEDVANEEHQDYNEFVPEEEPAQSQHIPMMDYEEPMQVDAVGDGNILFEIGDAEPMDVDEEQMERQVLNYDMFYYQPEAPKTQPDLIEIASKLSKNKLKKVDKDFFNAHSWEDLDEPVLDTKVPVSQLIGVMEPVEERPKFEDPLFGDPSQEEPDESTKEELFKAKGVKAPRITGIEQAKMYEQLQEQCMLAPERNDVEYQRFMLQLQRIYCQEEIQDKLIRLQEEEHIRDSEQDPKKIEDAKKKIQIFRDQINKTEDKLRSLKEINPQQLTKSLFEPGNENLKVQRHVDLTPHEI